MKHFGEHDRRQVILLGYNPANDKIMFTYCDSFSPQDREWLGQVFATPRAAVHNDAIRVLQQATHPSGMGGFDYVLRRGTLTLSPYELKMYSSEQSVEWFKTASTYLAPQERFAPQVIRLTPVQESADVLPSAGIGDLNKPAPGLDVPSINASIDIPMGPPRQPVVEPPPEREIESVPLHATHYPDSELIQPGFPGVQTPWNGKDIEAKTAALLEAADKLQKVLDLSKRLEALERKEKRAMQDAQRRREKDAQRKAERDALRKPKDPV